MPKSKSRPKAKRRPYVPSDPAKQKKAPKESPRWYKVLVVGLMVAGVAIIVLNYMNLIGGAYDPMWLFAGFGVIGAGFLMATRLR